MASQTNLPHALSENEYFQRIQKSLNEGQYFVAQDLSHEALKIYPESLNIKKLCGKALMQSGAIDEARLLIEPLFKDVLIDRNLLENVYESFRKLTHQQKAKSDEWQHLKAAADFALALEQASTQAQKSLLADQESLELLALIHKKKWQQSRREEDLISAKNIYLSAYEQKPSSTLGINAAYLGYRAGDKEWAHRFIQNLEDQGSLDNVEKFIAAGLKAFLLGHYEEAEKMIALALKAAPHRRSLALHLREMMMILVDGGHPFPTSMNQLIKPPTVAAFTGHMIDHPTRKTPRFPAFLEDVVAEELEKHLNEVGVDIGYSAAASGGDLLFLEGILKRDGEINVILPFEADDFKDTSVSFAGQNWEIRYRHILKLAHNLSYATTENYLGDDQLFQFGGLLMFGQALLRAKTLMSEPYLFTIWDEKYVDLVGGTSDIVKRWPYPESHLKVISVKELYEKNKHLESKHSVNFVEPALSPQVSVNKEQQQGKRVVRAMLFSDVVGFSKLEEHHVPGFIAFLNILSQNLGHLDKKPAFINTWGDAIFAVYETAMDMARYALALKKALVVAAEADLDLPTKLNLRIGLHVGPAYESEDPITGRRNYYGSHVNRAARIEPVTVPGRVYASEQFIGMLIAEESLLEAEAKKQNQVYESPWIYEYIGELALAKKFGEQKIYHLREKV
jgi:class 3 adenylate cyclase